MNEMFKNLLSIIDSEEFKNKLSELNDNFFNLKQEIQIRNLLVELFNKKCKEDERAFAEHPRIDNTRVDLSLVENKEPKEPFKIELKYHFPKDKDGFSKYEESIQKHFENRGSNGFILIVCNSKEEARKAFEEKWGIKTMFSKLSTDDNGWKENLKAKFKGTLNALSHFYEITVEKPFETTYHFFILERKN